MFCYEMCGCGREGGGRMGFCTGYTYRKGVEYVMSYIRLRVNLISQSLVSVRSLLMSVLC